MYKRQLTEYAQGIVNKKARNQLRNVKVTFIYGPPGTGKSTYIYNNLDYEETFCVDMYDKSMFTHYENHKNLVFDEFTGKVDITYMNKLLDRYPVQLRGLNSVKYASYENVYIVSNMSLKGLYKKEQEENPVVYQAFLRRVGKVIRFDENKVMHIEKDDYSICSQYETLEELSMLPFKDSENLDF